MCSKMEFLFSSTVLTELEELRNLWKPAEFLRKYISYIIKPIAFLIDKK